jgi:hypothetical protein
MSWYADAVKFVERITKVPPRNRNDFQDVYNELLDEYDRLYSLAADYKNSNSHHYGDVKSAKDFIYQAKSNWDDKYGGKF